MKHLSVSEIHSPIFNIVKEFEGMGTTVNTIILGFVATLWHVEKPEEIKQNI